MNAKRADVDADQDARRNGSASLPLSQSEALALVAQLEKDLATLRTFLDAEKHATKRKAPSPKRVARLRLVSEDITSAVKLSSKLTKG